MINQLHTIQFGLDMFNPEEEVGQCLASAYYASRFHIYAMLMKLSNYAFQIISLCFIILCSPAIVYTESTRKHHIFLDFRENYG